MCHVLIQEENIRGRSELECLKKETKRAVFSTSVNLNEEGIQFNGQN